MYFVALGLSGELGGVSGRLREKTIVEAVPHILEKNAVCAPPSTPLDKVCHFLFATSHYQDGIVVEDGNIIGRLGSQHILLQVRENIRNLKTKPVSEIRTN